jgi:preprotein translocase subunit SecY
LLNLFSGGALEQFSVFALGIIPTSPHAIMMQLLQVVIPKLAGAPGRRGVGPKGDHPVDPLRDGVLALIQSTGFTFLFHSGQFTSGIDLIPNYTPGTGDSHRDHHDRRYCHGHVARRADHPTRGWQRDVADHLRSILSQFPFIFGQIWGQTAAVGFVGRFVFIMLVFAAMIAAIIYVDQGQRRIPIQFAKRVRGRRVMGGQSTYIPLKVNTAG